MAPISRADFRFLDFRAPSFAAPSRKALQSLPKPWGFVDSASGEWHKIAQRSGLRGGFDANRSGPKK